jgi:hypothetical protein
MWTLILLLLAGDLVVGCLWWRERTAHQKSRRALGWWRDYAHGKHGYPGRVSSGVSTTQPTTVPLHLMDTDQGMAAARAILEAKVRAHRANGGDAA